MTNSLASNDVTIVHSGYAPSRKPLLRSGVRLFEVRSDTKVEGADQWSGGRRAESRLHTKSFVVDRQVLFLGLFNWDPRSAHINTELGVIINSPEIAGSAANELDKALPHKTYEVILDEDGQLKWVRFEDEDKTILSTEPETSWWDRFSAGFMGILPIKDQL